MARYIDADALIAEYDRVHIGAPGGARKLMVDAPTADVAPRAEVEKLQEVNADLNESLRLASEANKDLYAVVDRLRFNLKAVLDERAEDKAEVAREIFWEMDRLLLSITIDEETEESFVGLDFDKYLALRRKYTKAEGEPSKGN